MPYTISQLAAAASVTVRTLHHYDQIGLLKPSAIAANGYRTYGQNELLRLQQIMFFRELDFSLVDIKRMLDNPRFDMVAALNDHKRLIKIKAKRLEKLIKTINLTIKKMTTNQPIDDKDLYGGFTKEEAERYQEEARQRWGHTDAYKQSVERVKKMGKEGLNRAVKASGEIVNQIASRMSAGPRDAEVQNLIAKHYDSLRAFYEPNLELYRGLAHGYVADERFKKTFENIAPGLAQFMSSAMIYFCDQQEK